MKKVFVVSINFNNSDITLSFLRSLREIEKKEIELSVVIVDNSTKEKITIEENDFKDLNLKIITPEKNTGFAGGNNVGIKHALKNDADYVLVINNDVILDKNLLKELLKTIEEKNAGIVVPKIYFAKGFEFHKERYKEKDLGKVFWYAGGKIDWKNMITCHLGVDEVDSGQLDKETETEFATGCCMLVKKEYFEKVGLFNEKYFLYYEDVDLSIRGKRHGYKIIYQPKAVLWHENAGSTGGSGSLLQDYFITRNRMLFGLRYAPVNTKLALVKESIKILTNGRENQKKGIRDFYLGRFGRGIY
jgi:GT2 family glycosyltransferase